MTLQVQQNILVFDTDEIFTLSGPAKVPAATALELLKALQMAGTILFMADPDHLDLPTSFRKLLSDTLARVPFYLVCRDAPYPFFADRFRLDFTVCDRVVSPSCPTWLPPALHIRQDSVRLDKVIAEVAARRFDAVAPAASGLGDDDGRVGPIHHYLCSPGIDLIYRKAALADTRASIEAALGRAERHVGDKSFGPLKVVELGCAMGLTMPLQHGRPESVYSGIDHSQSFVNFARDVCLERRFLHVSETIPADTRSVRCILIPDLPAAANIFPGLDIPLSEKVRLVVLSCIENMDLSGFRTPMTVVQNDLLQIFPGTGFTLVNMQLIGHKPNDYLKNTAIFELDAYI